MLKHRISSRQAHAWLKHHIGGQRRDQAICVRILLDKHAFLLKTMTLKDGHNRVHISEEEFHRFLDHLRCQESGRRRQRRRRTCWAAQSIESTLNFGGKTGLSLGFAQFADHLRPRALGTLLLRNGIVCAGQLGGRTVSARVDAITFDLATMAGVASPLHSGRHGYDGRLTGIVRSEYRSHSDSGQRGYIEDPVFNLPHPNLIKQSDQTIGTK